MNPTLVDPVLLPLALLTPLVTAVIIFLIPEQRRRFRIGVNLLGAGLSVLWIALMLWGVFHELSYELRLAFLPGIDLHFHADPFAMLFAALSAPLWLLTTIYAIGYLEESANRARFFGFFSLCVAATKGIALSGNMLTLFIFYELLTLATYPLVVHKGTREALRAGKLYLQYTLGGGAVLLIGIVWLYTLAGPQAFAAGGYVAPLGEQAYPALIAIFALLVAGFGVKAALFPLHSWLPVAMVAPAPVSALLHAVAVVKAGAFGIIRTVYDVFGASFSHQLGVTHWLAAAAAVTIVYGSLRALAQDDLKRRLAFSTVSQVSYIALGVAIAGPLATLGGIVHLVHQGLMKITLFFCAGNLAEAIGVKTVTQMDGAGRRMPWTMLAFTVGALGMIGVPPVAGFISKWYLGLGGIEAGQYWVVALLALSTLLNAAYFLPPLYRAWFRPPPGSVGAAATSGVEAKASLLVPALITATLALAAGMLAGAAFSPLEWASLITEREYR